MLLAVITWLMKTKSYTRIIWNDRSKNPKPIGSDITGTAYNPVGMAVLDGRLTFEISKKYRLKHFRKKKNLTQKFSCESKILSPKINTANQIFVLQLITS